MDGRRSLEAAAERLEGFARRRLALPGLAVGLIGPGGWRREFGVGVADVASGRPLEPDALVPVASIGKAMTALALLREHQAGRVDLDAAVHDLLPWLPLPTPFGPISLRHLLAHTGGIVSGMEGSPSPTLEALALGQTTPGWPPPAGAPTTPTSATPCSGWCWSGSPAAPTPRPCGATCWARAP
jgi:CubicO group peptidase (beta-lactamase class C family)